MIVWEEDVEAVLLKRGLRKYSLIFSALNDVSILHLCNSARQRENAVYGMLGREQLHTIEC